MSIFRGKPFRGKVPSDGGRSPLSFGHLPPVGSNPVPPFQRLLMPNIAPDRAHTKKYKFKVYLVCPVRGKNLALKVFGKWEWGGGLPTVWGDVSEADRGDGLVEPAFGIR